MKAFLAVFNNFSEDLFEKYLGLFGECTVVHEIKHLEDLKLDFLKVKDDIDTIILHQGLPGTSRPYPVIDLIREIAFNKRIIYIISPDVDSASVKSYLVANHIYDFLVDDHSNPDLKEDFLNILKNPRRYEEVSHYYQSSLLESVNNEMKAAPQRTVVKEVIKTVVKNSSPVNFKKLILTVLGNAEFACEMAYLIAKQTDFQIAIIDMDLFTPGVAHYMSTLRGPGQEYNGQYFVTDNGINIALDSAAAVNPVSKEFLIEASVQRKDVDNLYVITGNYDINNYDMHKERYSAENVSKLIQACYANFDITILVTGRYTSEGSITPIMQSDVVIIPDRADAFSVDTALRHIDYLSKKHGVQVEKFKFVAYPYNFDVDLDYYGLNKEFPGLCLGYISLSLKRELYRNKKILYARRAEKHILKEYNTILASLNIIPKRKFKENLKEWKDNGVIKLRNMQKKFTRKKAADRRDV